ncbi:alpha/beta hydrolase fold domain-containing protein [Nocardia sp. R7R-8]|uniref:alpha/beta hydrolase fold domain-containing protein n=1 Tax=Nocardia sp. R7R-8 TaxID=3459304 RepID=UPI00403DA51C
MVTPRPCDPSGYKTYLSPELFEPDWRSFYLEGYQRTLEFARTVKSEMGVLYGDDAFQILDVFAPIDADHAPVLIYVHGGGFKEGHPSHYGYLGEPLVQRGAVFVSVGYRFEPEFPYPHNVDDVAQALKWVVDNISGFGGDPAKIFASGHSAGANIIAALSMRHDWIDKYSLPHDVIKGVALFSGGYDAKVTDPAYPDHDVRPVESNVVSRIDMVPGSMIVAYGYPEAQRIGQSADFFKNHVESLLEALGDRDIAPHVIELPGADHLQTGISLADRESPVAAAVERMVLGESGDA